MSHSVKRKKLAVLVSGHGSNLQALINKQSEGGLPYAEIALVISNIPSAYALERAKIHHITTLCLSEETPDAFDQVLLSALADHQIDWVILAGFMKILSPTIINAYPSQIINIHPSLLPKYKGLNTHQRVLAAQEPYHGCTVHVVIPALDAGPILAKAIVKINTADTVETLKAKVQQQEHLLYPKVIDWLTRGTLRITSCGIFFKNNPLPKESLILTEALDEI